MYKAVLLTLFRWISVITIYILITHISLFVIWFVAKVFHFNTSYILSLEYLAYGDGLYHENWFLEYITSFNFVYMIYIVANCWHLILDLFFYSFKCIFFFDENIWLYNLAEYRFRKHWNSIGYSNTIFFFYDLISFCEIDVTHFFSKIKTFIGSYLCPVTLYRNLKLTDFSFYYNEKNLLMVLGGVLFISSSIISLFLMSYLGLYGVFVVNLITILVFWVLVLARLNFFFLEGSFFKINFGKWFTLWGSFVVPFELYIDSISYAYILLTLTIAVFVYIYVFSYFRYEPNVERLLLFINYFVISMIILVSSGNFFMLFLGWELIGLTSFFLINFWSTKIATLKAAFKAYVFNKFSDVSIFIAIIASIILINDTNILVFNKQIHLYTTYTFNLLGYDVSYVEFISFFFLIAAFIKSAQLGTHIWLPDSMEAPAPASALIHSATLVSAGVYLILRFSSLFETSLYAYYILIIVGSLTAFFGGVCSAFQSDVKRILAYSTISHCGFLMVTCATKVPELTIFYLYVHGFFKASVFLCVGNIIRFSLNYQDFKKMGGYWKYLPFECIASLICFLNLAGLPFTLGFYIKHIMLAFLNKDLFIYYFVLGFLLIGALAGLFYSFRLYYYVFFDIKKSKKFIYSHTNRTALKSFFYSNTTLASNLAISLLIIVGYVVCIYIYFLLFNTNNFSEAFDIISVNGSSFFNLSWSLKSFLLFLSGFNWLVLQLIVILIFSIWRYVYNYTSILNTLFNLIVILIFFFSGLVLFV